MATTTISKKVKLAAQKILDETPRPKPAKRRTVKAGKRGIENAVERLRDAEVEAHRQYSEAAANGDHHAPELFKAWQQCLKLLGESEEGLVKFRKATSDLVPVEEMKKWFGSKLSKAQSILTNLPAKLAPILEGLPWGKIQKILDEEVRTALDQLSAA